MNASLQEILGPPTIDDFIFECQSHAWFLAELWGLDKFGQGHMQLVAAAAIASAMSGDGGSHAENARSKTNEVNLPAAPKTSKPAYRTPQSTIDAFWFVVRNEDPDYLAKWLDRHPQDAQHLHSLWETRCLTAPE